MKLQRGMSGTQILQVQRRLQELGFMTGPMRGNFGPQTEAAVKTFQSARGLRVDGMVGEATWGALFGPVGSVKKPAATKRFGDLPAWLVAALEDLGRGVAEVAGGQNNPDIVAAHGHTSLAAQDDETPWCSSIMCAWLERAGIASTRSAAAASWRSWGRELPEGEQRLGCIVVMSRPGGNHVALYLDEDDVGVYCLGGNQSDRVSVRRYSWANITNFRWPA